MVAPTSFFADYGCHVRIWEEIQVLQARGHQLVLTTYHNGNDVPGVDIRRSWDVPWIKRAMVGSSRHKIYLDVGLSWRSLRVALKLRPTVVHAHLHEGALIGAVLRRMLRVPLVFDYQGSMSSEMVDHGFVQPDSSFYPLLRGLETRIDGQADAIITSSHNAANLLRARSPQLAPRTHTVPDGVNTARFCPFDGSPAWQAQRQQLRQQLGIPPGARVVVYLGLLAPYQGTNVLLDAAQRLAARLPNVHFLIMGYPDPQSYQRYADSLGIGDRVTLPGRIFYHDAPTYLALGDVAVAPKMSTTEGSGKITNYLAVGLPTVAFDTPVSRELLGPVGIYARLGDADDLADKLAWALDAPAAAGLGAAGRARAREQFSWARSVHTIEAIYEQVQARLHGGHRPATKDGTIHTHSGEQGQERHAR